MSKNDDPWADGYDARLAGLDESANPYDPDNVEQFDAFCSWNDGWFAADDASEDEYDDGYGVHDPDLDGYGGTEDA